MSKSNTRKIILDEALRKFNDEGIEYVGVREIAKALDMRVGNVTYYFPTKDDIVVAIIEELAAANAKALTSDDSLTMAHFLDMYVETFSNHYRYRCLFISFVHILEQNKKAEAIYMPTQEKRYKTVRHHLLLLMKNGYLDKGLDNDALDYLVSSISIIVRFWLSESRVRFRNTPKKTLFSHYLTLLAMHFRPYATRAGKEDIRRFIEAL